MANLFSGDVSVLLINGDGTFAADVTYGAGDGPFSVAVGDLDARLRGESFFSVLFSHRRRDRHRHT